MIFIILSPIFVSIGGAVVLAVAGVLFSPVAAALCSDLARANGMARRDVWRYGVVGGIYAFMLVLPGLYLVTGMRGHRLPSWFLRWAYVLPFSLWGGCSAIWFIVMLFFASDDPQYAYVVGVPLVSLVLCGISAFRIIRGRPIGELSEWGDPMSETIPYSRYVVPFAGATLFIIGSCVYYWWAILMKGLVL